MATTEYKNKRSFDKTPEPTGGKAAGTKLEFVVQKHAASHLHYDFRLELRGVLKSWAVPKGPSINPADKRLAMLVEDHPFDYKDFEGIIPEGNYGAGTVIIWDRGTYEPAGDIKGKELQEKTLFKEFYSGSLKLVLHGKKLKGEFALVRVEGRGENAWLLMKLKDKHAAAIDISLKDKSVVSGKTIEGMANTAGARQWESNRLSDGTLKKETQNAGPLKTEEGGSANMELIKKGRKTSMPASVSPMLCTLVKEAFTGEGWLFEIKWDGYRLISMIQKGKAKMLSRSGLDYSSKYPPLVNALKAFEHDMVLDGEAVVFNDEGKPDFDALQLYNGHDTPITYCAFDILWIDGYNLMELPLRERKAILQSLLQGNAVIRYSEHFDDGVELYKQVLQLNLEGIVAKQENSFYQPGVRGAEWLKVPTRKRQEFVIGGWSESSNGRSFRSLLFGAYNDGKLEWIGRSGGGYKEKEMPGILKQLQALEMNESAFANKVLDTKGAVTHWVKPQLVANFEFATWTKSGRIRKPATFLGFRKDKKATDVVREVPVETETIVADEEIQNVVESSEDKGPASVSQGTKKKQLVKTPTKHKYLNDGSGWKKVDEEQKGAEWTNFTMENCTIPVHDLERELWAGIPKGRLLLYYSEISTTILPYIKDRPQSLNLKLAGAGGPTTFIKDMEDRQLDCATVFSDERRVRKSGKRSRIDYLVCNNLETLVYMVNLGCVDLNPWASRVPQIEFPDYIWLDLDPTIATGLNKKQMEEAESNGFIKAIEIAISAKKILDQHKLTGFIKTSGKTGLHIYIPCSGLTFANTRTLAAKLADEIHALVPQISTRNESIDQRDNKVYIDAGQNDYSDTLACPYSVRPYHKPLVSTPLDWKELKKTLDPYAFTIDSIEARLKKKGDLWEKIMDEKYIAANNKQLSKLD